MFLGGQPHPRTIKERSPIASQFLGSDLFVLTKFGMVTHMGGACFKGSDTSALHFEQMCRAVCQR